MELNGQRIDGLRIGGQRIDTQRIVGQRIDTYRIDGRDRDLIALLCDGLPLSPRPYWVMAAALGWEEEEVLQRLKALIDAGIVRRLGLIVRHHELGYRSNGMVVWDIPDADVGEVGRRLAEAPCVTLCYRRPRRMPDWPYNLFTMVHGKDRDTVRHEVAGLVTANGLSGVPHEILFSSRRFKQTGAKYRRRSEAGA